ncbi:MAG: hypothetical protein JHC93_06530 [Parachlamydiales bacterium]|nr:hypothetical protein [Parachlamydiales bacterium]
MTIKPLQNKDLLYNVLSFIDPLELAPIERVDKLWKKVIEEKFSLVIEQRNLFKFIESKSIVHLNMSLRHFSSYRNHLILAEGYYVRTDTTYIEIHPVKFDVLNVLTNVYIFDHDLLYLKVARNWAIMGLNNGSCNALNLENLTELLKFDFTVTKERILKAEFIDDTIYCLTDYAKLYRFDVCKKILLNNKVVYPLANIETFHIDKEFIYIVIFENILLIYNRIDNKYLSLQMSHSICDLQSNTKCLFLIFEKQVLAYKKGLWDKPNKQFSCSFIDTNKTSCNQKFKFLVKKHRCFIFCNSGHLTVFSNGLNVLSVTPVADKPIDQSLNNPPPTISKNTLFYLDDKNFTKVSFTSKIDQAKIPT